MGDVLTRAPIFREKRASNRARPFRSPFLSSWLATFHAISRRSRGEARGDGGKNAFSLCRDRERDYARWKERKEPGPSVDRPWHRRFQQSTLCSIVGARPPRSPSLSANGGIKIEGIAKSKEIHASGRGGAPSAFVSRSIPPFHSRCNLVLLRRERMNFDMGSGTWSFFFSFFSFSLLLYARYYAWLSLNSRARFFLFFFLRRILRRRKWRDRSDIFLH